MNVVTRGVRNAFRNMTRTSSLVLILGLSIGLALSMLIAYQAVGKKITDVQSAVGNTISISPAGVRGFDGGGSALTETQLTGVSKVAHVTAVNTSLSDRLTTTNTNLVSAIEAGDLGRRFSNNDGRSFGPSPEAGGEMGAATTAVTFTPPVTLIGTTTPGDLNASSSQGGGTFTLKSGALFASDSSENVALVGISLATKNNVKTGSTFTAYGQTVTVAGIFDAGNSFSNNQVIMPIKTVQTLSDQVGAVTSATVTVDSVKNIDATAAAISKELGTAADVTNGAEQAKQTIAPLENIQTISLYSLIGAIVAGAVIILMTMIMIVRERRREIGVLKAIGASNARIVGQFMAEAMTLTVLASVVGVVIGAVAANPITKLLVDNSASTTGAIGTGARAIGGPGAPSFQGIRSATTTIQTNVGWEVVLYGFGAAVLIALIGSALASFAIAKIRPAEVMRAE